MGTVPRMAGAWKVLGCVLSPWTIVLLVVATLSTVIEGGSRKFECTKQLQNRKVSLEYRYYPAYWLSGIDLSDQEYTDRDAVITNPKLTFEFLQCDGSLFARSKVCIRWQDKQFLEVGWGGLDAFFILGKDTLHTGSTYWEVWCDSKCNRNETTYNNCELRAVYGRDMRLKKIGGEYYWHGLQNLGFEENPKTGRTTLPFHYKLYTKRSGAAKVIESSARADESWFEWRIEASVTDQHWKMVSNLCATTAGPGPVEMKQDFEIGVWTTESDTKGTEVSVSVTAGVLSKLAELEKSLGFSVDFKSNWSQMNSRSVREKKKDSVSRKVGKDKMMVTWQLVGTADWVDIDTHYIRTCICCDCNEKDWKVKCIPGGEKCTGKGDC